MSFLPVRPNARAGLTSEPSALPGTAPDQVLASLASDATTDVDQRDLLAARAGDASAFEALVRRYQGPLYNFSLRLLGGSEDASDVAQDAFVQLYKHLPTLDLTDPLSPWLFRVARNRCIDLIRRRRTVPLRAPGDEDSPGLAPDDIPDNTPLPEEIAERADLQRLLAEAIRTLPPAYGEVVALRYAADRSFAEIAQILGCDEGAARVRFHRAKSLLRTALKALVEDA